MQYLMVLLLSFGVLLLMLAVVLGISYAIGISLRSRAAGPDPADKDPCAQCRADRDWYETLPVWQQNCVTVWWLANRYQCSTKGCQ
jgi:hypothetical protein